MFQVAIPIHSRTIKVLLSMPSQLETLKISYRLTLQKCQRNLRRRRRREENIWYKFFHIPFSVVCVTFQIEDVLAGLVLQRAAHERRWPIYSSLPQEQKDQFNRRTENHQVESNYSTGQPAIKKPKIMRQSHDNYFNNVTPAIGSVPSPVASQMSNMTKLLNGTRNRGRKPKGLKVPAGQPGSGSGWSKFKEQALVVLVHDLGPNWELVSDAFNNTFHFKCIFRKAQECTTKRARRISSFFSAKGKNGII